MSTATADFSSVAPLLREAEIFSALQEDDLAFIASRTSRIGLPAGGVLFSSGETATRFFIVRSGSIRVFRPLPDGGEDVMALFAPGDSLGDFDFARGSAYDACADAVSDSELLAFPAAGLSFGDLAGERPDVASRVKLRSLAMVASRLRSTHKLISENAPWVRELRRRAYEDPGTGLWSRAFLDEEVTLNLRAPTTIVVLKPRRFKELVDRRGHAAGDAAMNRIAAVLKELVRRLGGGWAVRVRSNETSLVVPQDTPERAAETAELVVREIAAIEPFPAEGGFPSFDFEASAAYSSWPSDGVDWTELFGATYDACLSAWQEGAERPVRVSLGEARSKAAPA